jgi:lipoprotein-anchoring transpeptidase ErfK/SrfK
MACAVALLAVPAAGCGAPSSHSGGPAPSASAAPSASPASSASPARSVAIPAAVTTYVAEGVGRTVRVYDAPHDARPSLVLPNPWLLNGATTHPVPQWFLVLRTRPDGWVEVQLPVRPNGRTGWLAPGNERLLVDAYRIDVSLHRHRMTVWRDHTVIYTGPVATGAAATPTPRGRFYLRVLLHNDNPASVYGPYAYGLSAHSEALTTFNGGDAEIGLHGNDDPTVLGTSVTHGCIRMDNTEITRLTHLLPLGTPVTISS